MNKTFFLEVSGPFQKKYWRYDSVVIRRYGWGYFAWGFIKVPFRQFCENSYDWEKE